MEIHVLSSNATRWHQIFTNTYMIHGTSTLPLPLSGCVSPTSLRSGRGNGSSGSPAAWVCSKCQLILQGRGRQVQVEDAGQYVHPLCQGRHQKLDSKTGTPQNTRARSIRFMNTTVSIGDRLSRPGSFRIGFNLLRFPERYHMFF